jgi:hypothetical protein
MNKTDKVIFGSFLLAFFPFLFSLIGLAIGFFFFSEKSIPYFFSGGIICGIILDFIFIRILLSVMFDIPFWIFAGFYILCSIFLYGIFMGFPVPELIMGAAAGFYWGRRICITGIEVRERENLFKKVPRFASVIMVVICISSAFLALHEKTIGEELQGMLGLGFIPEKGLIIAGILLGGMLLIFAQYLITRITLIKTIKSGGVKF